MPSPVARRWLWRGLIAAAIVLVAAGAAVAVVLLHRPGNISHPNLQFTRPTTTPASPKRASRRVADTFSWPWYGYDAARDRDFPAPARLRPPLHVGWRWGSGALLEFPPVIYHGTMFFIDDNGIAHALRTKNGHQLWQRHVGTLAATTPAVAGPAGLVLMGVLSTHGRSPGAGRFAALSMKTGRIVWSRPTGAGTESSPIVNRDTVYYGDQAGNLYSRNVRNGHLYWTYHASGAIKGGPALVNGNLYFGDYSGRAYDVNAVSGRQVWAVGTNGAHYGFGSGQFYATPAVSFGRVYLGNTDGRVYSFGARNGALAWATSTGAYVYGSAAVADPKGVGPTVYVGSYDGSLYAFNAQSGAVRWRHPSGGRISGSADVIGNAVYYSVLGSRMTYALDVSTGRQLMSFDDGAFAAVIADYHAIYLIGYGRIYQMLPTVHRKHAAAKRRTKARRTGKATTKRRAKAKATAKTARRKAARRKTARRRAAVKTRANAARRRRQ
jgi:outer membrane protein assembly factor BamB